MSKFQRAVHDGLVGLTLAGAAFYVARGLDVSVLGSWWALGAVLGGTALCWLRTLRR